MTSLRISMVYLDIPIPAGALRRAGAKPLPAHTMAMELTADSIRVWDQDCDTCGNDFFFGDKPYAPYYRPVDELLHLDASLRGVATEHAANRCNPVGAFVLDAMTAMEAAIARRDGSSVYFAAAGDRIKIGWSRKVGTRIAQLQTGNPEPVTLLATMPGGLRHERELHRRFAHARLGGEWFAADPELLAYIESLTNPNVIPFERKAG